MVPLSPVGYSFFLCLSVWGGCFLRFNFQVNLMPHMYGRSVQADGFFVYTLSGKFQIGLQKKSHPEGQLFFIILLQVII